MIKNDNHKVLTNNFPILSQVSTDFSGIFSQEYSKEEILIFFRKNHADGVAYRKLLTLFTAEYFKVSEADTISEYENSAEYYIDLRKYSISDYTNEDFDLFHQLIDVTAMMRQDRLMREHLNYYESYDLLISCTKFFIEFFKKKKYKILVTQIVDNYVMDIMCRIGNHYGVKVIGLVRFFFPGYVRITAYGEYNYLREPQSSEVEEVFNKLTQKSKTVFHVDKSKVIRKNVKYFFIYYAKYLIHYLYKHKLLGKLNYDYYTVPIVKYPSKIKNFFIGKYFTKDLSKIKKSDHTKLVYIPLHYYPEATVEYWVDNSETGTYFPSLFETIQKLSNQGYTVLIKEHPALYQRQNVEIYKELSKIKNAILIDSFISTYDVLDLVDTIVVWTGTSGLEAIMQGKKVAAVSNNYYNAGLLQDISNIKNIKILTEKERLKILTKIMSNCLPLNY